MTAPNNGEGPDWAAIRRAYETTDVPIREICSQFGVTKGSLENRQRKDRWLSRRLRGNNRRTSTLSRLIGLLEGQMVKLGNEPGDRLGDKETQQLGEIVKAYEKVASIEAAESKVEILPQKRDISDIRAKLIKRMEQYGRR